LHLPFDFFNVGLFFAVTSIILLITAQLISAYEGKWTIFVDQKKLRTMALITGILFLATVILGFMQY
jgi:hypothetical protein